MAGLVLRTDHLGHTPCRRNPQAYMHKSSIRHEHAHSKTWTSVMPFLRLMISRMRTRVDIFPHRQQSLLGLGLGREARLRVCCHCRGRDQTAGWAQTVGQSSVRLDLEIPQFPHSAPTLLCQHRLRLLVLYTVTALHKVTGHNTAETQEV